MERVINVDGMTCMHCKMTVERSLKKLSGVKSADVNLKKNQVIVIFNEAEVTFEQMNEAIINKGYNVIN